PGGEGGRERHLTGDRHPDVAGVRLGGHRLRADHDPQPDRHRRRDPPPGRRAETDGRYREGECVLTLLLMVVALLLLLLLRVPVAFALLVPAMGYVVMDDTA